MAKEEGAPLIKKGNAEPFATVVDDSFLGYGINKNRVIR